MSSDGKSALPGLPGYNPEDLQPWTVGVVVSMTVLALVSVGLRLVSRRLNRQALWLDDKMIVFSMVSFLCLGVFAVVWFWSCTDLGFLDSLGVVSRCCGLHLYHVLMRHGHSCRQG